MKKFLCMFVFIFVLAGHTAYADDIKLGFVDLMKALNESDEGKKAKSDLEFYARTKQSQIDEKGKEIEKLRGDLEKQSSVLSAEARKAKEDELEQMMTEYQRLVNDSNKDLKKKENDLTVNIIKEIRDVVSEIAEDEGYTMIIENAVGIILYAQKNLDLTDTVIKRYNESKAKSGKK